MSYHKGEKVDEEIVALLARLKKLLADQEAQSQNSSEWFDVIASRVKRGLSNGTPVENIKAYLQQEEELIQESLQKASHKFGVAESRKLHPGPLPKSQPKAVHKVPSKVIDFMEGIRKALYKQEEKPGGLFKVMVFEKRLLAIENDIIRSGGAKRFYDELNAMKMHLIVAEKKADHQKSPDELVVRVRLNDVDAKELQRLMGEYAEGFHADHQTFSVAKQQVGVIYDPDENIEVRLISLKEHEVNLMLRCPADKEDLGVFILTDLCQEWAEKSSTGITIVHIEDKTQAGDVREQLTRALNDDERFSSPKMSGE